jgi:hypothetical protein
MATKIRLRVLAIGLFAGTLDIADALIFSRKLALLTRRPILSGLIYGGVIYLVMNFVVLPASSVPHPKSTATIVAIVSGVLALLLCIGLPISVLTSRYLLGRYRGQ